MNILRWWERWPGRLQKEFDALDAAGIRYKRDETVWEKGALVLHLWREIDGTDQELVAVYPDTFPYTRFEIMAPGLHLRRHQNPFQKILCLIGRGTINWHEPDTIAQHVVERIPLVLQAAEAPDDAGADVVEEPQGEPFSDYYPYLSETIMLRSSSCTTGTRVSGKLRIRVPKELGRELRGSIARIMDEDGKTIWRDDGLLNHMFPGEIKGRWVRVAAPIQEMKHRDFFTSLAAQYPALKQPNWQTRNGWKLDVIGVVFPEEVRWHEYADGWVFLVTATNMKDPGRRSTEQYFVRAAHIDNGAARVPELASLAQRRVAVVGVGALGATSALEFARAGIGELRLLDGDIAEPEIAVRWPFGIPAAGFPKVYVIKDFLRKHYPTVKVSAHCHRLGGMPGMASDRDELAILLDGVDLIYDATAEVGIQHLLADLAHEARIPYICISATAGAWGGMLLRIRPGKTEGCWVCSQHAFTTGDLPLPPADPNGNVQPTGCADPTFTGTNFDLGPIAFGGVRLAVGTITTGEKAYPDVPWDVAIIAMRTPKGEPTAPTWRTFPLSRHQNCTCRIT